jgi:hypothetical protein
MKEGCTKTKDLLLQHQVSFIRGGRAHFHVAAHLNYLTERTTGLTSLFTHSQSSVSAGRSWLRARCIMTLAPSPRKITNARFRSKFSVSYEALLAGEHPWLSSSSSSLTTPSSSYSNNGTSYFSSSNGKKSSEPRTRFYADLLCLKVEPATVSNLVQDISSRMLVDDDEGSKGARIRDNIGSLWRECLRVWSDVERNQDDPSSPTSRYASGSGTDEVRRGNAIDTLLVLSRSILAKNTLTGSSTSLDLIWIFAGGIDEADELFESLVSAIEEGLRGELDDLSHQRRQRRPNRMPSSDYQNTQQNNIQTVTNELPTLEELLRHRIKAVHLAIIWVSEVSSTNLSAYFVRRDLFVAACSLLSAVQSIRESVSKRASQPGLAEADESLLRNVVRDVALLLGLLTGLGQVGSNATSNGSYSSASSHSMYYRRLCDWVDSGSMTLLRDAVAYDFDQAWKAYEADGSPFASTSASSLAWGTSVSLGAVTESVKRLGLGSYTSETTEATSNVVDLPPSSSCCLLPIYLLARCNEAFVQIALAPPPTTESANALQYTFTSSLLSLTSYLATHGSSSERSKSYSRLSLLTLLALLSSAAGISAITQAERQGDLTLIRQCQQKSGPKPVRSPTAAESGSGMLSGYLAQLSLSASSISPQKSSRLLPYILDCCIQYLRYNLRKRLDVSGYLLCLEVIMLSISACAERRILLEYSGWSEVWRSIQSVIAFVVGRHSELRGIQFGDLSKALLSTLSLALLESDRFLQSKEEINVLIYELVRNSQTLRRLACIAVTGKDPADTSIEMTNEDAERINSGIPGWRLIDMVLLSFEERLREWKNKPGSKGAFSFGLSVSTLTGGYFKGSATNGSESSTATADFADVDTVMSLIATIDLERLITTVNGIDSRASKIKTSRTSLLSEEWLERAETQATSEALRSISEDIRKLLSSSL